MVPKQGLHQLVDFDVEAGARELTDRGCRVFVLPAGIKDKRAFFDGVRQVLPLDPPVVGQHSWDALSDSLWSGLDGVDGSDIAIIWPGAAEMATTDPDDFEIAKSILSDLTESLADHEATVENVKQVVVVLA
jgi:hypothetical protein